MKIDLEKVLFYNKDQLEHMGKFQELIHQFCFSMMRECIYHDHTKFKSEEFVGFVESRKSLNQSQNGKDEEYQKHLKSDAIQHHILTNKHHPEYWDTIGYDSMPVSHAIMMFNDWLSRSIQRHTPMNQFWDYNIEKLEKQPTAKIIVEKLRKEMDEE